MRFRPLGSGGISVSEVGIGTWEMAGDAWGTKDDSTSMAAVRAGLDAGATFIDTAADYGNGHVEELIGRLWGTGGVGRDEVVVATKVRPENGEWAPPPERPIAEMFRPGWIRSECEASLQRLRTDHVDVLFLHTWSRSWGHEDDWYEAMASLRDEGKIRSIGISVPDEGVTDANVAVARGQVDVVQCVHSVFQQEPEVALFPLAARFGVGVVARSPFSSGALVQGWRAGMRFPEGDWRATGPSSSTQTWFHDQVRMAGLIDDVVRDSELDRAELCLRYVLGATDVSTVIPGSADPAHVRSNVAVGSGGLGLDARVRSRLKDLWLERKVHGTYNGSAS